jgi:three-Cys-motif partner protein
MNDAPPDYGYKPDKIGEWSERKIRIVSKYAAAYSKILASQKYLKHYYIDGFTGGGMAVRKETGEAVETTARRILDIEPPFVGYHLVDFDSAKAQAMKLACARRPQATAYCDDANAILPTIFGKIRYTDFQRALCFLDPYGIMLSWNVVKAAAANRALEAFIHFPTGDVQRNVLRHDQATVSIDEANRMTQMWGDESWRTAGYYDQPNLFGSEQVKEEIGVVIKAFSDRLKAAGFTYVSEALPMRNSSNVILYHLIFATHHPTALKVATEILTRESTRRA